MNIFLIEGEGMNKHKALKEQKIKATKAYLERRGVLHRFPKDKEFWEKMVEWVEHQIRMQV